MGRDIPALVARAVEGDRGSVAKLISIVESGGPDADAAGAALYPHTGHAYTIGLTGAPGAGKSSLTDALIGRIRTEDLEVGVLAIDPTSPFSGGAILGDRVRMQDHATDAGVYIRSMATRGHLGGLALATPRAARVLDAAGKPWIVVETVGVGQVEVDIAGAADTTVVVVNPGWGDGVQANKAGLMEIADLFVVNKADRDGVAETLRDLELMLDLSGHTDWRPKIVTTVATRSEGIRRPSVSSRDSCLPACNSGDHVMRVVTVPTPSTTPSSRSGQWVKWSNFCGREGPIPAIPWRFSV